MTQNMDREIIRFDIHAMRRMISEEEVCLVLENPEKVEKSIKGRINAYKSIDQRYIKVTYKEFSDKNT